MTTLYLADAPTYASHIAAYPENGAAILALPAGTRRYIENMQREVRRSANGKYWIPDTAPSGPVFTGSNAHWIAHFGSDTMSNTTTSQARKRVRPVYYQMPGFLPATISRVAIFQQTNGTVGAGTDSVALRLYAANPDGSPIVGAAPLFVWDFNAAGSGGAGTLTMANAGNNATRLHVDLPGGPVEVPPHFWLGLVHDLATAPAFGSTQGSAMSYNLAPSELSGTDLTNTLLITRSGGYSWDEAAAWAIGAAPVWPAAEYVVAGQNCAVVHLKVS